jgi:hypothetical protein
MSIRRRQEEERRRMSPLIARSVPGVNLRGSGHAEVCGGAGGDTQPHAGLPQEMGKTSGTFFVSTKGPALAKEDRRRAPIAIALEYLGDTVKPAVRKLGER